MLEAKEKGMSISRVLRTPVWDLVRGRMVPAETVGSLLGGSGLPGEVTGVIGRVVKGSRIKPREKLEVARELVSHFAEAMAAGVSASEAVKAFGDERVAARLIRRGVIGKRSLLWKFGRAVRWTAGTLAVIYVGSAVYFFAGRPTVGVDYVGRMNEETGAVGGEAGDRGWPVYRRALLPMEAERRAAAAEGKKGQSVWEWVGDAEPGGKHWEELAAYVRGHQESVRLVREGAGKERLGFVLGVGGDAYDKEMFELGEPWGSWKEMPLISVMLPHLEAMRRGARLLFADAGVALEKKDGSRFLADYEGVMGMARQLAGRSHFLVEELVGHGIRSMGVSMMGRAVAEHAELFSEEQLAGVAHRLAGQRVAGDLFDLGGERYFFEDVMQRCYTDDGHGDGRITPRGLGNFRSYGSPSALGANPQKVEAVFVAGSGALPVGMASRKQVMAKYNEIMGAAEANLRRPRREVTREMFEAPMREVRTSMVESMRYLPIAILTPTLMNLQENGERYLAQRDGVAVGIALEIYRRRHGRWPEKLSELVPGLLPAVPRDAIDGGEVRYRVKDGRPVVYSVGVDLVDDGGEPAKELRTGKVKSWVAAQWLEGEWRGNGGVPRGDWVLWAEVKVKEEEEDR